jgi:hypothetical protein
LEVDHPRGDRKVIGPDGALIERRRQSGAGKLAAGCQRGRLAAVRACQPQGLKLLPAAKAKRATEGPP